MIILGLETSCDETAAAVIKAEKNNLAVLSSVISSQVKLHAKWGGVVPNLAAREHLKNILPVIDAALQKSNLKPADLDLIAVTHGPGLIPALLIGTNAAKTLSYLWQKPLLGIHHIEGHIYANFLPEIGAISKSLPRRQAGQIPNPKIKFPVLCLVVSGGHTQLILMRAHLQYQIIGQTLDDAAGEAFDKVARILELGYPGGPAIAACAAKSQIPIRQLADKSQTNFKTQIPNSKLYFNLPRPMINSNNLDFSFSGLKTAVLYTVKKNPQILKNKQLIAELCAEFQQAVIGVLIAKTLKAAEKYQPKTILLAGGVSANQELREQLGRSITEKIASTGYAIPDMKYSLDNAAMIAAAGFFRWQKMSLKEKKKLMSNWKNLATDANLKMQ